MRFSVAFCKLTKENRMKKKILLTGGSGLIGSYFIKYYKKKFPNDWIFTPQHSEMDVIEIDSIRRYFDKHQPEAVVHFAAFRNATEAEKQRGKRNDSAWKINVEGSKNLAKVCRENDMYLIHISTDYVFAGHKKNPGPYLEKDKPGESERLLSWYGITKREAERKVIENSTRASIIRICNITRPNNDPLLDFVGKILWLYDLKKIYPMFNDQKLSLTYIPSLVDSIIKLISIRLSGIFHVSTRDLVTPYILANYLIERVYNLSNQIKGVSIDSYLKTNPSRYPKFGGLQVDFTQKQLNLNFKNWQEIVDLYANAIKKNLKKKIK